MMTAPATVAALPGSVINCTDAQAAVLIAACVAQEETAQETTKKDAPEQAEPKRSAPKKRTAKKD